MTVTAIREAMGSNWQRIDESLTDVFIAEEEIEAAQTKHPKHTDALWNTFRSLQRPTALARKADVVYRAHCAELLDRVATGDDLDVATRAEVMVALSDMTFKSRLIPDAEHLYLRLFLELGMELPGKSPEDMMALARRQFTWSADGQNRVFSQIVRRLDTKRPRSDTC